MTDKQMKLVIGSLLHDIGKVVYRSGDGRNHSQSGYDYLKDDAKINDKEILNCVRYHHGNHLKNAGIAADDLAYLTYYADNVAAAADRRESYDIEDGFDKTIPLSSIFNILNGNQGNYHFAKQTMDFSKGINYPVNHSTIMEESFYQGVIRNITENLRGIALTEEYMNSLLSILEANLSYIPSSTSKRELADISLFDHVKMTAAIALCMEQYFTEQNQTDYCGQLLTRGKETNEQKMFLLYSMDVSGIQNFIYTISSKGALKGLRARSFYLEIMMEHLIDELLERLSLCRTNLIYCGGGHSYLLIPNTKSAKKSVEEFEAAINRWFLEQFGVALYIAGGYAECSANNLKNVPQGSYADLYQTVSRQISSKKMHRYSAEEILALNEEKRKEGRECDICRRIEACDENNRCAMCAALEKMSGKILHEKFFTVISVKEEDALPLPGGKYLVADTKDTLQKRMVSESYVRCYTKNEIYTGKHVTTKLWVGDYTTGDTFEQLAKKAEGIERIAILRADVDNLGQAFVRGFHREDDDRYVTLSRTATLSRQLSLFFKGYINHILKNGVENRLGTDGERNVVIVYSGGDDVFLAGAWNDVIASFIDLKAAFERFTQGTLTISGGIGMYHSGYPINIMAKEVAELEQLSKNLDNKNGITLFDENGTFSWDVFLKKVMDEKFKEVYEFFEHSDERGKSFLYRLLNFIREQYREEEDKKLNRAQLVYLLSRLEPEQEDDQEQWERYRRFSQKVYHWVGNPQECRQIVAAMYLYVYLTREKEVV